MINENSTTIAQDALDTLYKATQAEYAVWFPAYLAAEESIYAVSLDEQNPSRGDLMKDLQGCREDRLRHLDTLCGF